MFDDNLVYIYLVHQKSSALLLTDLLLTYHKTLKYMCKQYRDVIVGFVVFFRKTSDKTLKKGYTIAVTRLLYLFGNHRKTSFKNALNIYCYWLTTLNSS